METANIKVEHAKAHLSHLGYGTGTNFTVQNVSVLMASYANHHSTSQKETIERLREELSNANKSIDNLLKENRVLKCSLMEIREQSVAALEVTALKNKGKAEQLLNTTEPKTK